MEAWLLESGARLAAWCARHPRHIAAILTAIAIPVLMGVLLDGSSVPGGVGTVAVLSAAVLGIAIGVRSEHLGTGSHKWRDWSVVMVGAILGFVAVIGFVIFVALFGSLLGLNAAAVVFGAWLVLRLAVAVMRLLASRRKRPA